MHDAENLTNINTMGPSLPFAGLLVLYGPIMTPPYSPAAAVAPDGDVSNAAGRMPKLRSHKGAVAGAESPAACGVAAAASQDDTLLKVPSAKWQRVANGLDGSGDNGPGGGCKSVCCRVMHGTGRGHLGQA